MTTEKVVIPPRTLALRRSVLAACRAATDTLLEDLWNIVADYLVPVQAWVIGDAAAVVARARPRAAHLMDLIWGTNHNLREWRPIPVSQVLQAGETVRIDFQIKRMTHNWYTNWRIGLTGLPLAKFAEYPVTPAGSVGYPSVDMNTRSNDLAAASASIGITTDHFTYCNLRTNKAVLHDYKEGHTPLNVDPHIKYEDLSAVEFSYISTRPGIPYIRLTLFSGPKVVLRDILYYPSDTDVLRPYIYIFGGTDTWTFDVQTCEPTPVETLLP